MEVSSICLIISATLSINPDRSQFFRYEDIFMNCTAPANTHGWMLWKSNSSEMFQPCEGGCKLKDVYPADSGVYWCQSETGECSNTVNITVSAVAVILESPAHPVKERDTVALSCSYKERYGKIQTSNFSAAFYKNGVFIGTEPTGKMIFPAVSKADEGFYKCEHPVKGMSVQSWLAVGAQPSTVSPPLPPLMSLPKLLCTILLFTVYTAILIVCIYMYRRWARAQANAKKKASDNLILERRRGGEPRGTHSRERCM